MAWRNCQASLTLLDAVNRKWPNRDRASDGTIGDAAHATRSSDHNPWITVAGMGVVRARDIDKDGIDAAWLAESLRLLGAAGDMRLTGGGYVIYNRRITKPDFSGWATYTGSNPHTAHLHVSFSQNQGGFDSTAGWGFLTTATPPKPPGVVAVPKFPLPKGHYFGHYNGPNESHGGWNLVKNKPWTKENDWIVKIQERLNAKGYNAGRADGIFGDGVVAAVTRFQRAQMPGTTYFGQVWADDWRKLLG